MRGSSRGASSKAISSATSASSAGTPAGAPQPRRAGDSPSAGGGSPHTWPTCDETSFRRRLWKAPPKSTLTAFSPYQLISTMVPSKPAHLMAVSRPAALALAWKTMSASCGACSARAKRAPRASTTGRRLSSTSIAVTSAPGSRAASDVTSSPTTPAPTTAMRSPGPAPPSHSALRAVSMLAVSVARRAGTPSGTGTRDAAGTLKKS